MNTFELDDTYCFAGFKKRPIAVKKGRGAKLWDEKGNEYIDCMAGIGVANTGHCHPKVVEAIKNQVEELIVCPPLLYNEKRSKTMQKLCEISQMHKAYLCNSGAEAVESAFKFAKYTTKKTGIVACMNSFHGRTHGALATTWKKTYREPFQPLMQGVTFVPFNNIDKMREVIKQQSDSTAAVILEVIQGEGGINPADPEYLQQVRALCDEHNILLIFDEIQTGFARTGKMFAHQHYDVKPDIMTCAKAIASGIPMAAVLVNEKVEIADKLHSNTFGGYPLTCAAALATIQVIEEEQLCQKAEEDGQYFVEQLQKINSPKIRSIKAKGLMIGIELKEKPQATIKKLMELGVMALPAGVTVLRLLPPLVITREEIDTVVEKIAQALKGEK